MKPTTSIAEVKQHLLQRNKQARHKRLRKVVKAKGGRVPVDGLDVHKAANKILNEIEKEELMKVTKDKNCYCHTCDKHFHYLGITGHRAAHKRRGENCRITYTNGNTHLHKYSKETEA